jgi:hypothetical protein
MLCSNRSIRFSYQFTTANLKSGNARASQNSA